MSDVALLAASRTHVRPSLRAHTSFVDYSYNDEVSRIDY